MHLILLGLHVRDGYNSSSLFVADFYSNGIQKAEGYLTDYHVFYKCTGIRVLDLDFLSIVDIKIEDALNCNVYGLLFNEYDLEKDDLGFYAYINHWGLGLSESVKAIDLSNSNSGEPTFSILREFTILNPIIKDGSVLTNNYRLLMDKDNLIIRCDLSFVYIVVNISELTCNLFLAGENMNNTQVTVSNYRCTNRVLENCYFSNIISLLGNNMYAYGKRVFLDVEGIKKYSVIAIPNEYSLVDICIAFGMVHKNNDNSTEIIIPPSVDDVRFYSPYGVTGRFEYSKLKMYMPNKQKYHKIAKRLHNSAGNENSLSGLESDYSKVMEMNSSKLRIEFY